MGLLLQIFHKRKSTRRAKSEGFAIAPILYLLGLVGVGAGVLFSGYSQILRTNQTMSNTLAAKNDLQGIATTLAATSWLSNDKMLLCPPLVGSNSPSTPSTNCSTSTSAITVGTTFASGVAANLPASASGVTSTGTPIEGGIFKAGSGLKVLDPWGHYYLYCRWENGIGNSNAIMIITAGANGKTETKCGDTVAGGDDLIVIWSTAVTQNRAAVWQTTTSGTQVTGAQFGQTGSQVNIDTTGDVTVPGTLNVSGTTTLGTTVIGNETVNSLTDNGYLTVTGTSTLSGLLSGTSGTFSSTLGVTGLTTLNTLSAGTSTLSTAAVTNNATVGGTFGVTGATTLGQVTAGSSTLDNLSVNNGSFFGGNVNTSSSKVFIGTTVLPSGSSTPYLAVGKLVSLAYPFSVDQAGNVTGTTFTGSFNGSLTGSQSGGSVSATTLAASGITTLSAQLNGTSAVFSGNVTAANFIGNVAVGSGGTTITGVIPLANGGTGIAASSAANLLSTLFTSAGTVSGMIPGADLVTGSVTATQLNSIVTAGTYSTVTVGADGRVTSGTVAGGAVSSITDGSGDTISTGTTGLTFTVGSATVGNWKTPGLMVGSSTAAVNKLDVYGAQAIGTGYAGVNTAPTNGLIVQGNVGIGTTNPGANALQVNGTVAATSFTGSGAGLTGIGTSSITGTVGTGNGGTGTSTTFTQGSIVFAGASGVYSQDNANFFYDATNHRVGIGTTTPTVALEVAGTIKADGEIYVQNASYLRTYTSGGLGTRLLGVNAGNTAYIGPIDQALDVIIPSGPSKYILTYSSDTLKFYTAGFTPRITINSTGSVGIGTTTPQSLLHIQAGEAQVGSSGNSCAGNNGGAIRFSGSTLYFCDGTSTWQSVLASGGGSVGVTGSGTTNYVARWTSSSALGTGVLYDNSTNVAIGTNAPTNYLSLNGQTARTIWMERDYTAATAGNNLTISAGGAVSGGTDLAGGNLILSPGITTGMGASNIQFQTYPAAASTATTDNTAVTAATLSATGSASSGQGTLATTIQATAGSGTDKNGGTLNIASGVSTGTGGSSINFQTVNAGITGATAHPATTAMSINSDQTVTLNSTSYRALFFNGSGGGIALRNNNTQIGSDATATFTVGTGASVAQTIDAMQSTGTNVVGSNLSIVAGNGTGTGGSGALIFKISPVGTSGALGNTITEAMRVTNAGNVGIATTVPTKTLEVSGTSRVSGASGGRIDTDISTGNAGTIRALGTVIDQLDVGGASRLTFSTFASSAWQERVRVDNSGNVGIGTATPQSKLHIQAGEVQVGSSGASCASNVGGAIRFSGSNLYYCDGTSTWQTVLGTGGGGGGVTGTGSAGYIPFWSSSTALSYDSTAGGQFYWDSTNHRLGIGLAAPSYQLDMAQTNVGTSGTQYMAQFNYTAAPTGTSSANNIVQNIPITINGTYNTTDVEGVRVTANSSNTGTMTLFEGSRNILNNISTGIISTGIGVTGDVENLGLGTISIGYGLYGRARQHSTGTFSNAYGTYSTVQNDATGTIGSSYALYGYLNNLSTGIFTNAYGVRIDTANAGTITNYYGLYLAAPSGAGTVGTDYAIYSTDTGSSYFAGKIGIGTTTPQSKLHIQAGEVQVGSSGASCASNIGGAIRFNGSTLYFCDGTSTWQSLLASGGGSTGVTGSGTLNYVAKWTPSGVALGTSVIYDNGTNVGIGTATLSQPLTVNGNIDIYGANNGYLTEIANATTTGTTLNKLAKLTTGGKALIAAITDTDGMIGVVVGGAGIAGNAQIAIAGQAGCTFDGTPTAVGDFVTISTTVAGACHDTGSTSRSTLNTQALGQVLSTTAISGSIYPVALAVNGAGGSATPAGTTGQVQYNSGSSTLAANSNFTWLTANNQLVVGTSASTPVGLGTGGVVSGIFLDAIPQAVAVTASGVAGTVTINAGATGQMAYYSGTNALSGTSNLYVSSSNIALGTSTGSYLLSLDGQAARTIGMQRDYTASTVGQGLTLQSGGAASGGTNLKGGNLVLTSGISTGTGTSSIQFQTSPGVAASTADNTVATAMTITGAGNVGIGTTGPTQKLQVNGTISSTSGGVQFPDGTTQTTAASGHGTLSCTTYTASAAQSASVSCSTGTVTGGGCAATGPPSQTMYNSNPSGNGWSCGFQNNASTVVAYAICCKIN